MIKTIDKIYQSTIPPKQTNVIWDDNGVLKIYRNGDWEPLCISEGAIKEVLDKIKGIENTLQSGLLTSYLHTAYANSADGKKDFSIVDSSDREYLGLYSDFNITPSKNPGDYKWTKIKGEQGEKGDQGINGTNGVDGAVGTNTYFHIKYSNSPDGIPMNDFEGVYMGTYVDEILEDSEDASKYTWVKIKGENGVDGERGIPGLNGADGKTSWLHIAYANSPDGSLDFSITEGDNKIYIGQYVDFEEYDSTDYTKYKWSRIQGAKGDSAIQFYTWLRYADSIEFDSEGKPIGGTGMSNSPDNEDGSFKPYMGLAYDQVVPNESDNYADYKWTKIQGEKGIDGVNGYTWIVYADKLPETSDDIYQQPTEKTEYIGIAPNKDTEEESKNPAHYTWSKFKGDQGIQGEKGDKGEDGKSYEYIYRRTKDENDVPNINGLPSENVDEYTPSGWEDNAQGVNSEYRAEWCCTRIKDPKTKVWGGWRGPALWSSYGKEGKDGGDIQYVYKRTAAETAPDNPTPQDYLNSDHYQEKGEYLNKEFIPIGWSDEPQGVNEYNPFEWTCVRKKTEGKWRDYKGPSLWAKYGKDGKDGTSIRIKGYVETIYDLPTMPEDANDCYVVGNNLFIWDKTYWKDAGPFKGENGANGISIEWKGQLTSHPQNPEEGWAYRNSDGATYIYRNGMWNIMVTDGEASLILELSNDADSVNCDYDGNIVDPNKPTCTTSLYKGTNKIDSGVTFEVRFSDSKAKGITIDGTGQLVFSDGYTFYDNVLRVTIYATYGVSTLSKTFTLSKNLPGSPGEDATKWFLKASSSIIVMDKQEVLTPSKIRINCYKQVGAKDPVEDKDTTIYWDYDTDTPTIGTNSGAEISLKKDFSYITFALKNADDNFYEIEKIPLVKDGKDGDAGRSIAVKGTFESESALKAKYPNGPDDYNDCYIVGTDLYVWDGLAWNNVGKFTGQDGKSNYLHVAFANSEDGTKDFSTTDDTGRRYMGQYVDSVEDDSITPSDYKWKKVVGAGINSTTIRYGISPNTVDKPTIWDTAIPEVPKGYYLWTETKTDYTDPELEDTITYTYSYQGVDGAKGDKGDSGENGKDGTNGSDGNGINSITVTYQVSSSYTTAPTTWVTTPPATSTTNKYLWQKQVIDFTNQTDKTITQVVAVHGATGPQGATGVGVKSITPYYFAANTIGSIPVTTSTAWVTNIAATNYSSDYRYLYGFTKTTFTNGTSTNTTPGILGVWGQDGTPGPAGRQGKTVYPAGAYDASVTYHSTDDTTPYVVYDEEYYQLNTETWLGNNQTYKNPKADIDAGNKNWIKFDKFEALFAKVGVIDNGTFGAAVFSGDYMFSQYGTTTLDGTELTNEYKNFNPNNPFGAGNSFYPFVCFNFYTGETWLSKNKVTMDASGNTKLGDFTITDGGLKYTAGDNELIINKEGISIRNRADDITTHYIGTDGNILLSNSTTAFNPDGSAVMAGGSIGWNSEGNMYISKLMGVGSNEESSINAYIDGGGLVNNTTDGKLMLATGIPTGSSTLATRAASASTRIYEKGKIVSNDVELKGILTGTKGSVGNTYFTGSGLLTKTSGFDIVQTSNGFKCIYGKFTDDEQNDKYVNVCVGASETWGASEGMLDKDGNLVSAKESYALPGLYVKTRGSYVTSANIVAAITADGYNYAFRAARGSIRVDSGQFHGLRPKTRTVSSGTTLTEFDYNVFCASGTIKLPSSPILGQTYDIFHTSKTSITINGNGKTIYTLSGSDGVSSGTSFSTSQARRLHIVWNGTAWYLDSNMW